MADNPLGSNALRDRVASARSQAGAAPQIAPPPPPDQTASPWNMPRPGTTPMPPGYPPPPPTTIIVDESKKETPKPTPKLKNRRESVSCYDLVNSLLDSWYKDQPKGTGKANVKLGQQIMRNGAILIRDGYPIDQLGSLIRIANDLVHRSGDQEDDRLLEESTKIRNMLLKDVEDGEAINANALTEAEEGEEDKE